MNEHRGDDYYNDRLNREIRILNEDYKLECEYKAKCKELNDERKCNPLLKDFYARRIQLDREYYAKWTRLHTGK